MIHPMTSAHWSVTNLATGENIKLARDVDTQHPAWVHEQCETSSESELQNMISQLDALDFMERGMCKQTGINFHTAIFVYAPHGMFI